MHMIRLCLVCLILLASLCPSAAGTLTLADRASVDAHALLLRPDVTDVEIADDPGYGPGTHHYRAVPLAALAHELGVTQAGALIARAADGFITFIPGALALSTAAAGPRGWLAVEPPDHPWPALPGKARSAGPFYILWKPTVRAVSSEYWAYEVVGLGAAETPEELWPQLNVSGSMAANAPERRGQAVFIATCLPCHRLGGAGRADVGPDLNVPMNPTRYFERAALLRLIRDSASVRHWPEQRMPAFSKNALPDTDIEAVVRYLEYVANR